MRIRKRRLLGAGWNEAVGADFSVEINPMGYRVKDSSRNPFSSRGVRREVKGFSAGSRGRLVRWAANKSKEFEWFLTFTYHDQVDDGRRAKADLNRFLQVLRRVGCNRYLWVCEFQVRGALHFHVWLAGDVSKLRAELHEAMPGLRAEWMNRLGNDREAVELGRVVQWYWLFASGQHVDVKAWNASVDCERVRDTTSVVRYCVKYGSKLEQKELPEGVLSIGRWWGTAHGMKIEVLEKSEERGVLWGKLESFARVHGFPLVGSVVPECDQAIEAWETFLASAGFHHDSLSKGG